MILAGILAFVIATRWPSTNDPLVTAGGVVAAIAGVLALLGPPTNDP